MAYAAERVHEKFRIEMQDSDYIGAINKITIYGYVCTHAHTIL